MTKKQIYISILVLVVVLFFASKAKAKALKKAPRGRLSATNSLRNCDAQGCGHYGAPRGARKHKGIDYAMNVGDTVLSPIDGTMHRMKNPYANSNLTGVEIIGRGQDSGYTLTIFYIAPTVAIGAQVERSQAIGTAQNVAAKYGGGMRNHIHAELKQYGDYVNPENHFNT